MNQKVRLRKDEIKMRKKAQMQMNETVFVVFLIMIIVFLGLVVYTRFQELNLQDKTRIAKSLKVVESSHKISFWPELECSDVRVSEFACLDIVKLKVLGEFINNSRQAGGIYAFNYYFDLLKESKISVSEVYPLNTSVLGETYWVLWDNPGTKVSSNIIQVPVNLYDAFTGRYALGIMELRIYG
jgi:heme/copper-type cytochrome/quinol oxidase subunit 2